MASKPPMFLNKHCIDTIDIDAFKSSSPYPWINPQGMLMTTGYRQLLDNMPALDSFASSFGKRRRYKQRHHDRYVLAYQKGMALPTAWQAFIDELCSDYYRSFVCRLLGKRFVRFEFRWHYTPDGCQVSPHCDVKSKLGTHIFYMNTADDWQPEWGGQTLILDDDGKLSYKSNPGFTAFSHTIQTETVNNRSLIFARNNHSWHGVKPIHCPDNKLRKVFAITYTQYWKRFACQLKPGAASLC